MMRITISHLSSLLSRPAAHLIVIIALGILVYSNTLHSSFQPDEEEYLVANQFVRDACTPLNSLKGLKNGEIYKTLHQRYVGFLSFAFNYRLHGFRVEGYHIFNIAVHLANSVIVYLLVLFIFRTPVLSSSSLSIRSPRIAFFAALFFVAHPVQTEAVTYIMQRLTSLAAFFYLLSFVLYVKWRLTKEQKSRRAEEHGSESRTQNTEHRQKNPGSALLYIGSILSAFLAVKTKENTVTLPVMLALLEFFFFTGPLKKRASYLLPFFLISLIVPVTTVLLLKGMNKSLGQFTAAQEVIRQPDYFLTELRVIVTYLRLLVLPVNQNFMYDYPVYHSIFVFPVLLSLFAEAALLACGIYFLRRSRRGDSGFRFVAFGIFWFFLALSVESSIIPLPYVINEYRLYLPSIGFFGAATALLLLQVRRPRQMQAEGAVSVVLVLAVLILSLVAYERNRLWKDSVTLWMDVVSKSPKLSGAHKNLGFAYLKAGRIEESVRAYQAGVRLGAEHPQPHDFFGSMLMNLGYYNEAEKEFKAALAVDAGFIQARYNLGTMYAQQRRYEEAISEFNAVLKQNPQHVAARNNLAGCLVEMGRYKEAIKELETILAVHPEMEDVRYNFNVIKDLHKKTDNTR